MTASLYSRVNSAKWSERFELNPKRGEKQRSAGKVMASVFWDACGIIFIFYLEKRQTLNSEYYIALLVGLKNDDFKKKRPHKKKKRVLFHQDNAPVYKSIKTTAKLHKLGYELLLHPTYSPDLAPSDFFSAHIPQNNACWEEI
jgi:[histone H3]-lysine36 N-dimethyltransferase SETMAR